MVDGDERIRLLGQQLKKDTGRAVADDIAGSDDLSAAEELAEEFVEAGYNPGTTADLTAAALFIALERGLSV